METILLIGLALVALLFMSNRNRKQQKKTQDFRSSLAPGEEVMTASGLFGTVVDVDDEHDIITLETTPGGSQTRWLRAAIAKRVESPIDEETETTEESDGDEVPRGSDAGFGAATSISSSTPTSDVVPDVVIPDDLSSLTDSDTDATFDKRERRDDAPDGK